jgi:uncharacterized protein with HEPN domain
MPKRNYRLFIADIKDSATKIIDYAKGKSYKEFTKDRMLTDAIIRNLEIIGEAVKNIPYKVRKKYYPIEWKKIAGLRDILIHGYFGIDYEILWDIVQNKIPDLLTKIKEILKAEKNAG